MIMGLSMIIGCTALHVASAQEAAPPKNEKPPQKLPFSVYSDQGDHFIPSGYMGDTSDIVIITSSKLKPAVGEKCIKVKYSGKSAQGANWAGVFWQDPANNWGTIRGAGYNLTGARKLKVSARGEKGGETIEFKAGGISGEYPDTFKADAPIVTLTPEWQEFEIDLAEQDLTTVVGGFCFALAKDKNPSGCIFYLDNIRYEP
jgi:hypothetical protein